MGPTFHALSPLTCVFCCCPPNTVARSSVLPAPNSGVIDRPRISGQIAARPLLSRRQRLAKTCSCPCGNLNRAGLPLRPARPLRRCSPGGATAGGHARASAAPDKVSCSSWNSLYCTECARQWHRSLNISRRMRARGDDFTQSAPRAEILACEASCIGRYFRLCRPACRPTVERLRISHLCVRSSRRPPLPQRDDVTLT